MATPTAPDLTCEVCGKEPAVGVAAMPGVPYSAAYGRECLTANAHPYHMLVVNTAMILWGYPDPTGSTDVLTDTAEWWQRMVTDTLTHLGKDRDQFDANVREMVAELEADQMQPEDEP